VTQITVEEQFQIGYKPHWIVIFSAQVRAMGK
jgi:hypothetical protein